MKRIRIMLAAALVVAASYPAHVFASGEVTFGAQNWWQSNRESKPQEFRQWPNGAYFEKFLVRGEVGKVAVTGWGSDLFLKQQALGGSFDKGIRWQLDGSYQQLPHVFSRVARSPYANLGGGVFALSDSLQRQNQDNAAGFINRMNSTLAVAPFIPLEHMTNVSDARLRFRPSRGWQLQLIGEERAKNGTKPYSMTFGFSNTNEVVEPINQRTTNVTAIADYSREKVGLRLQAGYSAFSNRVDALIVDNPRRATDSATLGASRGRLDLYPDNSAVRGQADLSVKLAKRTQFSGTMAVARLTQNDPWLPFTINSAFSQATLDSLYPGTARSTDAKAIRLTQNYRLTSRVTDRIRGTVRFRQQHYDNQTEAVPFRGVVQYDQSLVRDTVGFHSHPVGNQQVSLGTDWDARLARGANLSVGYEHRWLDHTLREVEKDQEDEVHGRFYADLTSGLYASAGYSVARRRVDEFLVEEYQRPDQPDTVYVENPGLRRFDVADRDKRAATAQLGWALTDQLDVSVNGEYQRNRYGASRFGLQADDRWTLLGQATFAPSDVWDLTGGYGRGRMDTNQASQERTAAGDIVIRDGNLTAGTDWTARIRDRNDFAFAQATWKVIPRTLALSASYSFSRDQARYHLNNETNTAVDLPSTFYRHQEGQFEARYRLSDGTEMIGRYGYDTWAVDDFAAKDIPLLGVAGNPPGATAIYLGAGFQDYTAHAVSVGFARKF
jgi:MtrB/PioB family decaheme-associated outer membrane protein